MIIEIIVRGKDKWLLLIPTPDEAKMLDSALGSTVQNDDGLIAHVDGAYKISDGYGPAYLSLKAVSTEKKDDTWEEPE